MCYIKYGTHIVFVNIKAPSARLMSIEISVLAVASLFSGFSLVSTILLASGSQKVPNKEVVIDAPHPEPEEELLSKGFPCAVCSELKSLRAMNLCLVCGDCTCEGAICEGFCSCALKELINAVGSLEAE